jgi:glycosyltransferase involved in cell wall biosynthesis
VAIATSDYVSMPEAVDFGRAGLISPVGDAVKLAENILTLLDPETNYRFRAAARRRFEEHFSWEAVAPKLLAAYESAIESFHGVRSSAGSR